MVALSVRFSHSIAKSGEAEEYNEDAYCISISRQCYAVADGATGGSFSGAWARRIAQHFIAEPLQTTTDQAAIINWLAPVQQQWHDDIPSGELTWFAAQKLEGGAAATLIGLSVIPDPTNALVGTWRAVAIGDSCVFNVRDDELIICMPLCHSSEFSRSPALLYSVSCFNQGTLLVREGTCLPGDLFFMCTDALAKWFIREWEHGATPWNALLCAHHPDDFKRLVEDLRQSGAMDNDDVTLLALDAVTFETKL